MRGKPKPTRKRDRELGIEHLELNWETIQDLTEPEAEKAGGGLRGAVVVATSNCACSICCNPESDRCV